MKDLIIHLHFEKKVLKRLIDIVLSSIAFVILLSLFAVIAMLIKLDSPGHVFYRGVRIGRHRKPFRIYKFRTMIVNADRIGGPSTADDDPRITKVGSLLRKYKLDELPQLINILKGEMSFVGPRPEVPFYVNMFTEEEKKILTVKPGITDWASLWNPDEGAILAGSSDAEKVYMEKIRPKKIQLQLEYVKKHSLSIDLKIVLLTLKTVLKKGKVEV